MRLSWNRLSDALGAVAVTLLLTGLLLSPAIARADDDAEFAQAVGVNCDVCEGDCWGASIGCAGYTCPRSGTDCVGCNCRGPHKSEDGCDCD